MPSRAALSKFTDEHLLYEIEMVAGLTARMLRHVDWFDNRGLTENDGEYAQDVLDMSGRNADIEAFVMHASNVWNVLRGKRERAGVVADDFLEEPQ
jgi:hypothetical protein